MPKTRSVRPANARAGPIVVPIASSASKRPQKTAGPKKSTPSRNKTPLTSTQRLKQSKPQASFSKPSTTNSYLVQVSLVDSEDPYINRVLCVSSKLSFKKFHKALQIAFGWSDIHEHSFSVVRFLEDNEAFRVLMSPDSVTRNSFELLRLLPATSMNRKAHYPEPYKVKCEDDYTLGDIYDGDEYRDVDDIYYDYDRGDRWWLSISLLGRADPAIKRTVGAAEDSDVFCINGEGHPSAEDCGGIAGWEELKKAFKKRGDPDGLKAWYKHECSNGDPKGLDPYKWDISVVDDRLEDIKA